MPKPYDIVFISNGEPNADDNFNELKEKFPRAKLGSIRSFLSRLFQWMKKTLSLLIFE